MNHFRLAIVPAHEQRNRIAIEEILDRKELYVRTAYDENGLETAFLAEGWMDADVFRDKVMQPLVPYITGGIVRMLPCGDGHFSDTEEPAAEFVFDQAKQGWTRHRLPVRDRLALFCGKCLALIRRKARKT